MKVNFGRKKQKNSQNHRWNEVGRDDWRSLGPPGADCAEPYPNDFYLSPRKDTPQASEPLPSNSDSKKAFPDVQKEPPMP